MTKLHKESNHMGNKIFGIKSVDVFRGSYEASL